MFYSLLLSINLLSSISGDTSNTALFKDSLKEDIVIRAYRASDNQPITQFNLSRKEIGEKNYGQDISFLLQNSPSIIAQSDAGNMMGYSYFRIRGIDYTRINFGINGIPVNDPEMQGFFSNNFADLATSAQNIQIQRGVGTTANGTAPIAGSINITTLDLNSPRFVSASVSYGSFNSIRQTAEYNSGVSNKGLAIYARGSYLKSDGYRENSNTDLKTYLLSMGKFGKKSILKFNFFGGSTHNQLAFYPVPSDSMRSNRTFNPLQPDEKDRFMQFFNQIQYTYKFNDNWSISASAYYVKGIAPMFALRFNNFDYTYANMPNSFDANGNEVFSSNMLVSYRLNQDFMGAMAAANYKNEKIDFSLGIHANGFKADHFMEILRADVFPLGYGKGHHAYFNTGYKNEISQFAKLNYKLTTQTHLFLDYQIRIASFRYSAKDKEIFRDTFKVENMQWAFLNPKIGFKHNFNAQLGIYYSFGMVTREPTRFDYLGDDRANFNVKKSDVTPETVYNSELGAEYNSKGIKLNVNLYAMEFRNEIAATGALNSFGYPIRGNVKQSFRRGVEISASWRILPFLQLINHSSFSYNRIKEYTQNYAILDSNYNNTFTTDSKSFKNVNPILTPQAIVNQIVRIEPTNWLLFDFTTRYVGKSYLDNTNSENLTAPEYIVSDLRTSIKFNNWIKVGETCLSFQVNNIFNTLYSPAGTAYQALVNANGINSLIASPSYFPAATRNFFITLSLKY